jgi:hypothetical protein
MKNIFIKLKNGNIEINHIREIIQEIEKENFTFKNWFPRPGLKEKNTDFVSRLYIGQSYDKNHFDLVENGWINDHCEICFETSGYFDGSDWICKTCFEELVLAENLESKLNDIEKFGE